VLDLRFLSPTRVDRAGAGHRPENASVRLVADDRGGPGAAGRYQAFGNLFATVEGTAYRLDRHPTMSRHPVTPMTEADLRLHLSPASRSIRPRW
jgi:hypothetical protein